MQRWLESLSIEPSLAIGTSEFVLGVLVSLLMSVTAIGLYKAFYSRPESGSEMQRAYLLMGPSVTALFLAIQFSIPLSLGLFGVFAIVRFRNPVRDPEELGFLMLLLAGAVIAATLQFHLLLLFWILMTLALASRRLWAWLPRRVEPSGLYVITLGTADADDLEERVAAILEREVPNARIENISFAPEALTVHCGFKGKRISVVELGERLSEVAPVHQIDVFLTPRAAWSPSRRSPRASA